MTNTYKYKGNEINWDCNKWTKWGPQIDQVNAFCLVCDINSLNGSRRRQMTILQSAILGGADEEIVRTLLIKGANVNVVYKDKNTPLHHAVKNKLSREIVTLLLDAGADLKAKNNDNKTPLFYADKGSELEALLLLRESNVDKSLILQLGQLTTVG